jgi:hypothetical protein
LRRAVVHLNVDPSGALSTAQLRAAVAALRDDGHEVRAGDLERLPRRGREIELLGTGDDAGELRRWAEDVGLRALAALDLPALPRAVAVSFMSTGTHEDAVGIVRAFGMEDDVDEIRLVDEDRAVLVLAPDALQRPACGKLQTVLEAALNREVTLTERTTDSS